MKAPADGQVLVVAQGNQVSGVDIRHLPEVHILSGKLLSVGGENVLFLRFQKDIAEEGVGVRVPGIAGAVPSVVTDIEGLIPGRGGGEGPELVQAVRAFHSVGLAHIGLDFVQYIVLLGIQQGAGEKKTCQEGKDSFHRDKGS